MGGTKKGIGAHNHAEGEGKLLTTLKREAGGVVSVVTQGADAVMPIIASNPCSCGSCGVCIGTAVVAGTVAVGGSAARMAKAAYTSLRRGAEKRHRHVKATT